MRIDNLFWVKTKLLFSNKQTQLILYLTLFVSVFITSVGLFLYENYKGILDKELNQPHTELLQINLGVTNREFRVADEQAVKVSFHSNTLNYVQGAPEEKKGYASVLSSYLNTIAFHEDIHSVYVLDLKNKQLVSDKSEQSMAWTDFPDQTWLPWVEDMKTKPLLIKRRTLGSADPAGALELISLYRPILAQKQLIGVVIVNVDYDRFFSKIYPQLETPQYIFSLEGEVIYPKLKTEVPLEELYKAIDVLGVRPFGEVKLEGQSYLGNQAFSDMTGWRWVSLVPLDRLLKNVRLVRDIVILLSLVSIVAGSAAIFFYNFAAFKPIKRIRQLLVSGDTASSGSDLHDLETVVQRLLKEFDSSSSIAERSLPELRSKYIQDVLMRRIGTNELHEKWNMYFARWTKEPITAVAVSINRYTEWASSLAYTEEDQLLLKYALVNIMTEMLESGWRVHCVPLDKENLMLVIQSKVSGRLESDDAASLQEALGVMTKTVAKYLQMSLSAGIGSACESVSGLHQSFEEAKEALARRLYEGYDKTIRFSEVTEFEPISETDAGIWKAEILESLDHAEITVSKQVLERWGEWVRNNSFAPESVYSFVNGIIGDYSRIITVRGINRPAILDNYTEHQLKMMDLEDLQQLLLHLAETIINGIRLHKPTKEYQLTQRIVSFMEEHLDQQIGLQEIADFVNLSTSSVSSAFKTETGSTIYEYLTKMRIEQACRLLAATDLKIADIALRVGYQNENSFIRSFRKLKNVTPGKYREANK